MAIGDIGAVIDTLEFDTETGRLPVIVHISGDVYAIAYQGPDNHGWLCTIEISADGQIGAATIDTLEFDGVNALYPNIIPVSGNIYAIAYTGPDNHGWVCTVEILANGQIGAATIDTLEFDGVAGFNSTITLMSGNIYGIAYSDAFYGTGGDGWLCSVEILTDGQVGAAIIDSLEFAPDDGDQPSIIRVADTICAIAVGGPENDGWVYTVEILADGQIGAAPIDSLEFEPVEGFTCRLIHISGDIYAVVSSRSDDGLCRTFEILANGQIGAAVIDTLNYAPVMGSHFTPTIIHVGAGIYAVSYRGPDQNGLMCTFKIENNGQIGDVVLDILEFDPVGGAPWNIHISGGVCAIAYRGPDADGWLCTVDIETVNVAVGIQDKSPGMAAKLVAGKLI